MYSSSTQSVAGVNYAYTQSVVGINYGMLEYPEMGDIMDE